MTMIADVHKVSPEDLAQSLADAREELKGGEGDLLLDFSLVQRIDQRGLCELGDLADAADEKSVRIELRGVNVSVYKVLKLLRLDSRFLFNN